MTLRNFAAIALAGLLAACSSTPEVTRTELTNPAYVDFLEATKLSDSRAKGGYSIIKWDTPIRYMIAGEPSAEQRAFTEEVIAELAAVSDQIRFEPVDKLSKAKMKIAFTDRDKFNDFLFHAVDCGCEHYEQTGFGGSRGGASEAGIVINKAMHPDGWKEALRKDLAAALGLRNLENRWGEYYTAKDKAALALLYSDVFRGKTSYTDAKKKLIRLEDTLSPVVASN